MFLEIFFMFLQVKVVQRIVEDDFDREFDSSDEIVVEKKKKSKRTKASTGPAPTTYTATKQFQPNPNFFSDIFNVRNFEGFSLRFKIFIRFSDSNFNAWCSQPVFEQWCQQWHCGFKI